MTRILRNVASLVVVASLGLAACGDSEKDVLLGYIPASQKFVGSASVTEAATGEPFVFKAAKGEVLIAYFGYTMCPDVCPTTLVALKNAKRKLGELATKVDVAMTTVDRERDTVTVLPKYLGSFLDRYHALVPRSDAELRAAEEVFQATSSVTKKPDGTVQVVHGGTAYVVDDAGYVVDEFPFGMTPADMAHDLQILLTKKGPQT